MGKSHMSKQVTPRDYGEDRNNPVRSLLLLRAWALWRARKDGWADARSCRAKRFNEQEAFLERGARALNAPCRLLGNTAANKHLRDISPDLVARLRPRG